MAKFSEYVEAFQIFAKHAGDLDDATDAQHDELRVNVDPRNVCQQDMDRLAQIGFHADYTERDFYHFT